MKDLKLIIPLFTLLIIVIITEVKVTENLKTGDLAFTSFKAIEDESFTLVTFKDLKPNSIIYFTDSEWNGNHFGADEGTLIWNTGDIIIKAGTQITFNNINTNPISTLGSVKNILKLSKFNEALFAYVGTAPKVPDTFIAAVANNTTGYGTLINTGLIDGETAITYPINTYQAEYLNPINILDENMLISLNDMSNYSLNTSSNNYSNSKLVNTY